MNKFFFLLFVCFLIFPGVFYGQSGPRFYLYNYFLIRDEHGNVRYKTSHSTVTKIMFKDMAMEPPLRL